MSLDGKSNMSQTNESGTQALVLGAGMAGLFAARVLAEYYDQVCVVERDTLPEGPENRPGTPQAFHLHRLLFRGDTIIERLFPGYIDELLEHGAFSSQNKIFTSINAYGRQDAPFFLKKGKDASSSRALLEWTLRRRVQALMNVRFLTRLEVIGFHTLPDQMSVDGVYVRSRGQLEQHEVLTADLVVDTRGRSSKASQWVRELGYDVPEPERLKSALGYTTRYYKVSPQFVQKRAGIIIEGQPEKKIRTSYSSMVGKDQFGVILFSAGGFYPPTDAEGFEQGLRQLLSEELADVLQEEAEPITQPRGYRILECLRQHYEQMERWPSGLLVMGDAFCNVDPIYGQGMSMAAIEAEILGTCLREQPQPDFERRFFLRIQGAIESAWWLSAIADRRWPGVEYVGPLSLEGMTLAQKYFDLYLKQARGQIAQDPRNPQSMGMFMKYMMINGLMASPREIVNLPMIDALLEANSSSDEGRQLTQFLDTLSREHGRPFDQIFDEIVPTFEGFPALVEEEEADHLFREGKHSETAIQQY
jgi:2-polyprenyl-6-methoxyphenol hydroxylase-like FAD-dependent oxidoreductase